MILHNANNLFIDLFMEFFSFNDPKFGSEWLDKINQDDELWSGVGAKDHRPLDLDQKDHIIEIKMIMIQSKKMDHH